MQTTHGTGLDDTLTGGADEDLIYGYAGNDDLSGGAGDDTLDGGEGGDRLDGGDGNDRLIAFGSADTLIGGDGEDTVVVETADTVDLTGGAIDGIERLEMTGGGYHEVRLTAEQLAGIGAVSGGAGLDLLIIGGDADLGGVSIAGVEKLSFLSGHVDLRGATLDGADTVEALTPNTTLVLDDTQLAGISTIIMDPDTDGDGTPDTIEIHVAGTGGTIDFGHIDLQGVDGARLIGSAGDDVLTGAAALAGSVTIDGGDDNDTLSGATTMRGQGGDDVFVIGSGAADTSVDFALGDVIRIDGLTLSGPVTSGDGMALTQGQVQVHTQSGQSTLEIGVDGTAGGDLRIALNGVFEAGRFAVSGSEISYTPSPPPPSGNGNSGGDSGGDAPPAASGTILGSPLGDALAAGPDDDTLYAGEGDDTVMGGLGNDVLYGNQGADIIYGNIGSDTIFGGQDADTVFGGQDADALFGNMASDVLYGNLGADSLFGGQGDDTLFGGQGDDVIAGNLGDDVLAGNLGADTFAFAPGGGADVVSDFRIDQGDRLQIAAGMTWTVSTGATGAMVSFGNGDQVTLAGINAQDVQASWFVTG
ncbi:MAG TPA: hypothetical protein VD995_06235 [Azospirillum sp.]|nr:hypothetical protein [Azospirillum sp.]